MSEHSNQPHARLRPLLTASAAAAFGLALAAAAATAHSAAVLAGALRVASLRYSLLLAAALGLALAAGACLALWLRLRRLREEELEHAHWRERCEDALRALPEGICLIDADFVIREPVSPSLFGVLQRKLWPGMDLVEALRPMLGADTVEALRTHLRECFAARAGARPATRNPLAEVVLPGPPSRQLQLGFRFEPVRHGERVVYLLVVVGDIGERLQAARELAGARLRLRAQLDGLLRACGRDGLHLRSCLGHAEAALERARVRLGRLRGASAAAEREASLRSLLEEARTIKREAAAIELELLETPAHHFELELMEAGPAARADEGARLATQLDVLAERIATVREFVLGLDARVGAARTSDSGRGDVGAAAPDRTADTADTANAEPPRLDDAQALVARLQRSGQSDALAAAARAQTASPQVGAVAAGGGAAPVVAAAGAVRAAVSIRPAASSSDSDEVAVPAAASFLAANAALSAAPIRSSPNPAAAAASADAAALVALTATAALVPPNASMQTASLTPTPTLAPTPTPTPTPTSTPTSASASASASTPTMVAQRRIDTPAPVSVSPPPARQAATEPAFPASASASASASLAASPHHNATPQHSSPPIATTTSADPAATVEALVLKPNRDAGIEAVAPRSPSTLGEDSDPLAWAPLLALSGDGPEALPADKAAFVDWAGLARRLAGDQGKAVRVEALLEPFARLPPAQAAMLRDIGMELVANAVLHGIEPMPMRRRVGKDPVGAVRLSLSYGEREGWLFCARDDGRGINVVRVRAALVRDGGFTPLQAGQLSEREAIMKVFEPGVTTAPHAGGASGRGLGLPNAVERLRGLRAQVSLLTVPGRSTEVRIAWPAG
jgi:chemotaxis protein histidine kinase CheA